MSTLPIAPPSTFAAGDTVAFTQAPTTTALGAVSPAEGWALSWLLRKTDGADSASATTTDDGTQWTVTLAATTSATLQAGAWRWVLRATKSADVVTLSHGTLTVTPDLGAVGEDVRTWEEKTLAVVEGALAGTLEGELRMYMIAGRQVQTFGPEELMRLRAQLRDAVASQQRGSAFGSLAVRFVA